RSSTRRAAASAPPSTEPVASLATESGELKEDPRPRVDSAGGQPNPPSVRTRPGDNGAMALDETTLLRIRERAAGYDRDNAFPDADLADLQAAGHLRPR